MCDSVFYMYFLFRVFPKEFSPAFDFKWEAMKGFPTLRAHLKGERTVHSHSLLLSSCISLCASSVFISLLLLLHASFRVNCFEPCVFLPLVFRFLFPCSSFLLPPSFSLSFFLSPLSLLSSSLPTAFLRVSRDLPPGQAGRFQSGTCIT